MGLSQPKSKLVSYDFASLGKVLIQRNGELLKIQLVRDTTIVASHDISMDRSAEFLTTKDQNSVVICATRGKLLDLTILEVPSFSIERQVVELDKNYIIQDCAWCNGMVFLKASKQFDSNELLSIDTHSGTFTNHKTFLRNHKVYPDFIECLAINENKCLLVGLFNNASGLYTMSSDGLNIEEIKAYSWEALEEKVGKIGGDRIDVKNDTGKLLKGIETLEDLQYSMERYDDKQFERFMTHNSINVIGLEDGKYRLDLVSWCNLYRKMEPPYLNDKMWELKGNYTVVTRLVMDDNGNLH